MITALNSAGPGECVLEKSKGAIHLTQKVDYGLFLLLELLKQDPLKPLSLKTMAKRHQMSFYFLQNVARALKQKGIIISSRGKAGGYRIAKRTSEWLLKDVIEALEGPIVIMQCLNPSSNWHCLREPYCTLKPALAKLNQELHDNFLAKPLSYFVA